MNDLLHSFGEQHTRNQSMSGVDHLDDGVFWRPVYRIDRELEKLFGDVGDVGGRTADIYFIEGFTNLIIDNKELRMHSTKAAHRPL